MALSEKIQKDRNELVKKLVEDIKTGKPFFWNNGYAFKEPRNLLKAIQGKDQFYRGINNLRLTLAAYNLGFKDSRWATFKQAQEAGAKIKKGSKGVHIEYWQYTTPLMEINPKTGKKEQVYEIDEKTGKKVPVHVKLNHPIVKDYVVFNAEQMEGITLEEAPKISDEERNTDMENMIKNSEAPILYDQVDRNFYIPSKDTIHVMPRELFTNLENFYSTVSHEIAHSTGHEKRLDRDTIRDNNGLNEEVYAKEELRAELTSMFLAQKYNIHFDKNHYENHAAYLQSWAKVLEDNPNEIFKATAEAEKAMIYIENRMINLQKTNELEVDSMKLKDIQNYTPKNKVSNCSQIYLASAQKLLKENNNIWKKEFNDKIIKSMIESKKNILDINSAVTRYSPSKITSKEILKITKSIEKSNIYTR